MRWTALAVLIPGLLAGAAEAEFEICNETQSWYYNVDVGYFDVTIDDFRIRGSFGLGPGACFMVDPDSRSRLYYFRARYSLDVGPTLERGNGGDQALAFLLGLASLNSIEGDVAGCVGTGSFNIIGDRQCARRGYDVGLFVELESIGGDCLIEFLPEGRYIGC